jgi:uncharacterized membrane protein
MVSIKNKVENKFGIVSEKVADFLGTPMFLLIQTFVTLCWILGMGLAIHFDPFPFILFTLILSVEAIYLGCFILVASKRSESRHDVYEERDRLHREELFMASAEREELMIGLLKELLDRD